ncbi:MULTISPECIES: hypothetical protein [unclassified Streptomyces]|uniref:hypothetical protein n=1 Tax=unclassified Streptomyces TaxID=2593676 RepID=UPI00380CEE24
MTRYAGRRAVVVGQDAGFGPAMAKRLVEGGAEELPTAGPSPERAHAGLPPLGRLGSAEGKVAREVLFLATDSTFTTGARLPGGPMGSVPACAERPAAGSATGSPHVPVRPAETRNPARTPSPDDPETTA